MSFRNQITLINRNAPSLMGQVQKSIYHDLDQFLSEWMSPKLSTSAQEATWESPACDLEETSEHYVFHLDIPGVKKDDISIQEQNSELWVKAKRSPKIVKQKSNGGRYRIKERSEQEWMRGFSLPERIDASKIEAKLVEGVLTIKVPKVEPLKPVQIAVH